MLGLIDSLLNLEHIEQVGLQCKDLDVRDLIGAACPIQPRQPAPDAAVEVPETLPLIQGDMHWMYRALINLLSNAHKYTPEGGAIAVSAYVQDDDLFVEVKDNGPGIPSEAQTRLFERFYRVPGSSQDIRGTGLGLAIVKTVVEQHGGRVFVQSKVGQGSIFGMVLPLSTRRGGCFAAQAERSQHTTPSPAANASSERARHPRQNTTRRAPEVQPAQTEWRSGPPNVSTLFRATTA